MHVNMLNIFSIGTDCERLKSHRCLLSECHNIIDLILIRPMLDKSSSVVIVWLFEGHHYRTENGKGRIPGVLQTIEPLLEGEQTGTVVFHVTCV